MRGALPLRVVRRMRTAATAKVEVEKRIAEADGRIKASADHEREMARQRVKDVEGFIYLTKTRTEAIRILRLLAERRFGARWKAEAFLRDLKE